jgi:hypothetical protein
MRELGSVEGKNLALEVRDYSGNVEVLPRMAPAQPVVGVEAAAPVVPIV